MKKIKFLPIVLALLFSGSCHRNSADQDYTAEAVCYTAYSGSDSASLSLRDQYERVEGNLSLYFAGKDNLTGKIRGNFTGDTLFADYTYRLGGKNTYYKNEIAFLRRGNKLYQGYGEITSTYGMSHLNRKLPINFSKGFVFSPSNCK